MKRLVLFFIVFSLLSSAMIPTFADRLTDMQKQKRSIESRIKDLTKQKKNEEQKLKSAQSEKMQLESAQEKEKREYKELTKELAEKKENIKKIEQAIRESEEDYNSKLELFKNRLRIMYENSGFTYTEALSDSKNVVDFFGRLELVASISKNDKQIIEDIKRAKKDIEFKKILAEEEKSKVQKKADDSSKELKGLTASRANVDAEIKSINSKLENIDKQEDQLIEKSNQLIKEISKLQTKKAYAGGSMAWPVPSSSRVSSAFGNRIHPILKKKKMHTGIDISAKQGASIVASNKGTVIISGWQNGYGNTVVIDHGGGRSTLYAHCSKLLVGVGDNVKAGQTIAKIGSTGLSTGPHLHFEVRERGTPKNPLNYVKS